MRDEDIDLTVLSGHGRLVEHGLCLGIEGVGMYSEDPSEVSYNVSEGNPPAELRGREYIEAHNPGVDPRTRKATTKASAGLGSVHHALNGDVL